VELEQQQQALQFPELAGLANQFDPVALKLRELEALFRQGSLRRDKKGVVRAAALAALLVGIRSLPSTEAPSFQLQALCKDVNGVSLTWCLVDCAPDGVCQQYRY
jgi:hypothetical protein